MIPKPEKILKGSGNYKNLICFQKAEIVYDLTCYFCTRYLDAKHDRTVDQMVQAARSGKQNIAEGNVDGASSTEMELNLLNAAFGSQAELRTDFEDWLRVRDFRQWEENSEEMKAMWRLGQVHNDSSFYVSLAQTRPPETVANMALAMLNQSQFFLHRLIESKQKTAAKTPSLSQRIRLERKATGRSRYQEENERWEQFLKQFRENQKKEKNNGRDGGNGDN